MKLALAMIVKGTEEEAGYLTRCLTDVAQYVDGIFITISGGDNPEAVRRIAELWGANVSEFKWVYDFSAARNFNFAQVTSDYTHILWLDADDTLQGAEKLRETIEQNPQADVFTLFYMYAFDEWGNAVVVHQKSQIVKRGAVEWVGEIHEDFKPLRELNTFLVKGIERIHLSKPEHFASAKARNLEVSEKQLEAHPEDPRCYWNVGNALYALGRHKESLKHFEGFILRSNSDDEKYIVRLRMAEALYALGRKNEALDQVSYAIGTKPLFPDAYHLKGYIYLESGQYNKGAEMFAAGLTKKPPYTSILVFNPRNYDLVPLKNLAKCYYSLDLPSMALTCLEACLQITPKDEDLQRVTEVMRKEAKEFEEVGKMLAEMRKMEDKEELRKALENVPKKYQDHPGVCNIRNLNFIKEASSGKDLAIYCSYTMEEWNPETAKKKGIGGSEEAVIWLSKLLVERGWDVTVYNNCGEGKDYDGVHYKPFWTWNYRDKQDVVILWRHPKALGYDINAGKIFVDLHDVIPEGEFTEERLKKVNRIFVKSDFHRSLFPNVPDEKFAIIPNGIDAKLFEKETERDPLLMVNTSSPDRSLEALVDCYERIKAEVPKAKLKWAYGWRVFDDVHAENAEIMAWKDRMVAKMKELGVEELGRVSHSEVANLYLSAGIFAYPTEFAEIDCISLTKAQAAGATPVTSDFAALGGKQFGGYFVKSNKTKDTWAPPGVFQFSLTPEKRDEFVRYCVQLLKNPPKEEEREQMRKIAREKYDWQKVVDQWSIIINQ